MSGSDSPSSGCCSGINTQRKQYGITCTFAVFAALNGIMMYMGIQAIHICPAERMVPNYLIVAGSLSLSLLLVRLVVSHLLIPYLEQSQSPLMDQDGLEASQVREKALVGTWFLSVLTIYDSFASVFSTIWLVVGSIYVYGVSPDFQHRDSPKYCDYNAYMFAFVVITIGYISLGLSILAALFACVCRSNRE
ncbi:hypothetical protein TCAL_01703 [Tigriopus californicus]|uniref:G-protein coupled receptors family 1 profile domain-containing protein n=2 Tax=Tigriopus californicus TaxID=6832 RepID=A0A553PML0_TIGCA|nr:hypothetical protein TCAL_01703 [Tigriopus californicus]|eukprot:TCALIF_01703-PA protein Name:"Protein of unknown function" AED:0.12 eAED:0.12 QI:0/1/0.5/1/1/1/2/82/191